MRQAVLMAAVLVALAGCALEPPDAAPAHRRLLAAGNLNNLYVATADGGSAGGFQFWQRDARGTWHEGGTGQGTPAAIAAWRENLLVFFPTGRYGLFGLGRPVVRPSPVPTWVPVAVCEDGLGADAFGWNAAGEPVHARFDGETWSWRRVEAALERDKVLDPSAIRFAGRLFILWREEVPTLTDSAPHFRLRFVYLEKDRWHGPVTSRLRVASAPQVATDGHALVCLFTAPAEGSDAGRWTLAAYATADEDWHETGALAGTIPAGPLVLARSGQALAVAALAERRPSVAPLDAAKPAAGEFVPLAAEARPAARPETVDFSTLALAGLAAMTLLMVLATWRREQRAGAALAATGASPAATGAAPAGPAPAPVARRGVAILIDYLLVGVPASLAVLHFMPEARDRMMRMEPLTLHEILLIDLCFMGALVLYCAATEAAFGKTLGKRLLGLEVRTETGLRISIWKAVVRNLLRVVDELPAFYLLGLALILMGPRPQRLGDRLARTLVVRSASPSPPEDGGARRA